MSSALGGVEKTKKSFEEKTREKSIRVGMEMAMSLLGELHKIECYSCSWDQESTSEKETKQRDLPPTIEVQEPPLCSKPLSWMEPRLCRNKDLFPSTNPTCNPTNRHFDTRTSSASPGRASNSTLGSRHHDEYINAGPGEASNSNDILVCRNDELPLQLSANAIELRAIALMEHLRMEDLRAAMITPRSGPLT